jgi:transglutaminase-like putative cysteine protease
VQVLRKMPRSHDGQFVKRWRVETDADCRLDRDEDAFGNITHTFSMDGPIETMTVVVEGEVDTIDKGGLISGTVERLPLGFWLRETPLTRPTPIIREFAHDVARGEGGDRLAALHALMAAVHRSIRFQVGETDAATPAADAFARQVGVCQDLAHVFIAAARAMGAPARYVGGYFLRTDLHEQEAGHAWAEAHVEGVGWLGFDPAHAVCVTDRYVRVGIGADYLEAAPVRGTRIGGGAEALRVKVSVREGRAVVEG